MGHIGDLLTKRLECRLLDSVLLFFNLVRHLPIEKGGLRMLLGFVKVVKVVVCELLLRLELA